MKKLINVLSTALVITAIACSQNALAAYDQGSYSQGYQNIGQEGKKASRGAMGQQRNAGRSTAMNKEVRRASSQGNSFNAEENTGLSEGYGTDGLNEGTESDRVNIYR